MMDEEVKQLAVMVLLNAFYDDFSGMVNKYLEAGEGLDTDLLLMKMGEMAEVYSRDHNAHSDSVDLNIWSREDVRSWASVGHTTLYEALQEPHAVEVYVGEQRVFTRRYGEWYFVGD